MNIRESLGIKYINILNTGIAVTNMDEVVTTIINQIDRLRGQYICVSNVHTTVMSYEDKEYRAIQNGAALTLPDGSPLSAVSRKRGYKEAGRVAGPDLMTELFERSSLRHYFYGGSEVAIQQLEISLREKYPQINIAGMVSPPFRPLTTEEDEQEVIKINDSGADIIWVGLGAPKQERWMAEHQGSVCGVMIGVGAGFDFHAGTIKRAPKWIQKMYLEWLYRLCQDPKRLWKRYVTTNFKFIYYLFKGNK